MLNKEICSKCNGKGYIYKSDSKGDWETCKNCDGNGYLLIPESELFKTTVIFVIIITVIVCGMYFLSN